MAGVKDVAKLIYGGLKDKTSAARLREIMKVLKANDIHREVSPEKIVSVIEDLGPTFIKIGQLLSAHSDVLPPAYAEALASLRSNTTPEPFEAIEARLRGVYGDAYEEIFEEVSEKPLGSASIAQVHKARLRKDGTLVAVKIQRENVKEDMLRDIQLLRRAIDVIDVTGASVLGNTNLHTLVDELEDTVREEIDFTAELSNIQRFIANSEGREGIAFPRPYPEYSSETVLVMEFVEGYSFDELDAIRAAGYDLEELGQRIARNYMSQMVEDGLFHADPHAANFVVRPLVRDALRRQDGPADANASEDAGGPTDGPADADGAADASGPADARDAGERDPGEIVWIDCGMVGELSPIERAQFFTMVNAMLAGDSHTLTNVFIEWGHVGSSDSGKFNYGRLLQDLTALVNRYTAVDAASIDLASMLNDIMDILRTSRIEMPRSFVMLVRGLAALQGTLISLSPDISIFSVASEYAESYLRRTFDPVKTFEHGVMKSKEVASKSVEIPVRVANVLDMAEKGRLSVSLDLTEAKQPMNKLGKMANRLSLAIITAGLFVGSSMIYSTGMQPQLFGVPIVGFLGYMGAAILSIYIVLQIRKGL